MFPPKLTPKTKRIVDGLWLPALTSFLPLMWAAEHPERRIPAIAAVTGIMGASFALVALTAKAERRSATKSSPTRIQGATYNAIVAFDFDGTITSRCSTMAFLYWRAGLLRFAKGLVRLAPAALRYWTDFDRDRLKTALLTEFLAGATPTLLRLEAERYAKWHAIELLRSDALDELDAWRDAGAQVAIVSASPFFLVKAFADLLKVPTVLATELEVDDFGRLTGELLGRNCRGKEKVYRLQQHFGRNCRIHTAYGDSSGDRELLAAAQHGHYRAFRDKP